MAYLCTLGRDWDSMLAASRLNRENLHLWSDHDWLKHASGHDIHDVGNEAQDGPDSDSGESVWEEVTEAPTDAASLVILKKLKSRRLLRRIVTAHQSGKLIKILTAFRATFNSKPPNRRHGICSSPSKRPSPLKKNASTTLSSTNTPTAQASVVVNVLSTQENLSAHHL